MRIRRISCRMILALMGFLGTTNVYFCRINLSMAVVDMLGVKPRSAVHTGDCPEYYNQTTSDSSLVKTGEFDWDQQQRGLLLGSYYYGYTIFQIPCGYLCSRFGMRRVFGGSMLLSTLLTLIFPLAARTGFYLAVSARCLLGVLHASTFPAFAGAWGAWAPPEENSKLNGITCSGSSAGTCIIFFLAGVVIKQLGWSAIFYLTGGLNLLYVLAWFYLVYDTPDQHPRIDPKEKQYIQQSIGQHGYRPDKTIPWRGILASPQVWGLMLGHAASNWGNYTLNQQLPTYLADVLRLDLEFTGLLSSLCYVLQWAVCLVASYCTDLARTRGILSTIHARKINTVIGLWVTGLCVGLAGMLGCNVGWVLFLFLLSAGLNSFTVPGCKSSMLDIAPAYSGIVFAISNTLSNIPGFLAPQLVGTILVDSTVAEWQAVFWVSCGVHVAGSLLYLIKGSDQLQEWAKHADSPAGRTNEDFTAVKDC